ncbi:M48 family metalloprotease [Sphingosinicella sp. YJ22]|uniref:M48 family metalloprotease n=1 Tax=Sphingosinicella sp. YJ22 TaxID=1104780 RepID=UPI001409E30C|nr:M48 family metalloprotease [Sphingosinicella sp. YJ22]
MAEALHARRGRGVLARLLLLLVLSFAFVARPAMAQSVLRDAETEALFRDMSAPLIEAAGLRPADVRIVLLNDASINAFVAGGQIVYLHSGLITSASNANEVQGVIAHELGHVTGGHIIRLQEGIGQAGNISLLSLLLGAAAIAVGAPEAGMAIITGGQAAAMSRFLAFSRVQENSADQAGASFLSRAGISGRGSIAFFEKLQNQEFRLAIPQTDSYQRTHPLNRERIAVLENVYRTDPAWDRPTPPELEARFQRVRAKLRGYIDEPERVLAAYPDSDTSVPARYARAFALHRAAYPERSLAEVETLLAEQPHDPYFLELKGQILLESGRPTEAITVLREAVERSRSEPLIATMLGHALIATEDPANFPEAERVLRTVVQRDERNPFAWFQLGVVYDRAGDLGRANLASAERYSLMNEPQLALASARNAMAGITAGTPDWIRAQDIVMVSRAALENQRGRRRRR